MDIKIANLADYIDSIPLVAMWLYGELGYAESGKTLDDVIADLAMQCHVDSLPMTLVGLSGPHTVGAITLVAQELDSKCDYSPWIAFLYVSKEFRRQGVGTKLLKVVADQAKALGFSELYLHTPVDIRFYEKAGWQAIQQIDNEGQQESIMKLALDSQEA